MAKDGGNDKQRMLSLIFSIVELHFTIIKSCFLLNAQSNKGAGGFGNQAQYMA